MTVFAIDQWKNNGSLIRDVATLGYLRKHWVTLDPTYGHGTFWTEWAPDYLFASDLDQRKSPCGEPIDFRTLPWKDCEFHAVVFDPPYKLNGTPDPAEERYGVHVPTHWRDRMRLITDGVRECARVCGINLLVKCKDQVCSGQKRWQTDEVTEAARSVGFRKIDRFDFLAYREQPYGTRQVHAWSNSSQLLVFQRGL